MQLVGVETVYLSVSLSVRVRFEPERTGTPFLFCFDHRNAVPVLFGI